MKIIKHGKKTEPKILRFECPKCGCVFEAEDKECSTLSFENFYGERTPLFYGTECPECGKRVTINA